MTDEERIEEHLADNAALGEDSDRMGYRVLAEASRYSDARSEERGDLRAYIEQDLDVDFASFNELASQRALRATLLATGRVEELGPARRGEGAVIRFNAEEQKLNAIATISIMDGFSIGLTAARMDVEAVEALPVDMVPADALREEREAHDRLLDAVDGAVSGVIPRQAVQEARARRAGR